MPFELLAQYLKLPVFALVAARLGGLLMFQPVLGSLAIPHRLRVMLVLALAALMTPLVHLPAAAPDTPLQIAFAMGLEVLLGGLIGLVTVACFLGVQIGGQLIAQEAGLAFGQIVDPNTDHQQSVIGVLYVQLVAVVYLVIGGHRALVSACLDTFQTIPLLADGGAARVGGEMLCDAIALSGHVAFQVTAPAMLALFLVNVAMGFVSRTVPQLNILAVGFSLKAMVAFLLMAVSLPSAADAFIESLEQVCLWLNEFLGTG